VQTKGLPLADREYIKPPIQGQDPYRYFLEVANKINEVLTMLKDMDTYANNAAAVTGGLSAGDIYKTATGELRIVV